MEYKVKLNEFEGPLDLLLHLIKESNIDIYDIKVEEITRQYLDYIKAMEKLNLTIASEYLVMAAELIQLKSKCLLPNNNNIDKDEYEEDSREQLIQRLLDYKNYKEITNQFKELENKRQLIFTKLPSNINEYTNEKSIKNNGEIGISDLLDVFQKFLDRKEIQKPLKTKVAIKEVSIQDRINVIRKILNQRKRIMFDDLFDNLSKQYIVVTFLSVLEMAKKQELLIKQDYNFDKIYLELKGRV